MHFTRILHGYVIQQADPGDFGLSVQYHNTSGCAYDSRLTETCVSQGHRQADRSMTYSTLASCVDELLMYTWTI